MFDKFRDLFEKAVNWSDAAKRGKFCKEIKLLLDEHKLEIDDVIRDPCIPRSETTATPNKTLAPILDDVLNSGWDFTGVYRKPHKVKELCEDRKVRTKTFGQLTHKTKFLYLSIMIAYQTWELNKLKFDEDEGEENE